MLLAFRPSFWSFWYDGNCFEPIPHYGITNIFGYNSCSIEPSKLIRPDQFAQTPTKLLYSQMAVCWICVACCHFNWIYIKLYIIHVSQSPLKLSFETIQMTFWPTPPRTMSCKLVAQLFQMNCDWIVWNYNNRHVVLWLYSPSFKIICF